MDLGLLAIAAVQPSLVLSAPAAVTVALEAVRKPLAFVEDCMERQPRLKIGDAIDRRHTDYWAARSRAEGIWGATIDRTNLEPGPPPWPNCRAASIAAAVGRIDAALLAEASVFAQATAGIAKGVWIGPLNLCRETVRSAMLGKDYVVGQPLLLVRLTPAASTVFAAVTDRSVNRRLAIRLDGKIVAEPIVFERMETGQLEISGPEQDVLDQLQTTMTLGCG